MKYTSEKHLHNFSVWAAARATQRNFTTTIIIQNVFEACAFKSNAKKLEKGIKSEEEFDEWHKKNYTAFRQRFHKKGKKLTYGRYAKLVSIYLKTSYIITKPKSKFARFIHPPIDRILLTSLFSIPDYKKYFETKRIPNWTQLNKVNYFKIISTIRDIQKKEKMVYPWMIEAYWNPAAE